LEFVSTSLGLSRLSPKLGIDGEVWLLVRDRSLHFGAILKQEEIAQKWSRRVSETALAKCGPDVFRATNSFLRTIVDIVAD
jgi:hypothetical protein